MKPRGVAPVLPRLVGDRYQLTGEVIAAGGMGQVHAARDRVLERDVALKLLTGAFAATPEGKQRFMREATAAAKLSHPNAVAVFDAGEEAGVPYIVMERLAGRTLADEIAGGPLPSERVRRIALELGSVLRRAHSLGILHRDVKPSNVLIGAGGEAKLADFGIAKTLDSDLTRTREVLGTPAYLAPEILEGAAASPATDVYALGVTLYEAASSVKPFRGATPWAIAAAARQGNAPIPAGPDASLAAAIAGAIAADPADRIATADEFLDELERPAATREENAAAVAAPTIAMELPPSSAVDAVARAAPWWLRPARIAATVAALVLFAVLSIALSPPLKGTTTRSPSPKATTVSRSSPSGTSTPAEVRAPNPGGAGVVTTPSNKKHHGHDGGGHQD